MHHTKDIIISTCSRYTCGVVWHPGC